MTSNSRNPDLRTKVIVLLILLASAFLLPFAYRLDIGPGPNGIRAVLWEYLDAPWFSGIRFVRIGQMLEALLYTFPTYIYIYQAHNLFSGQANRKRMAAVGIISAVFPGMISLIRMIGWIQGWTQPPPPLSDPYFPIYIPIPSTILISLILIRLFPVKNVEHADPA